MKVLASVYACSPYDGSERAVGWNWIRELDKFHEITALTSHVYRTDIEDYLAKHPGELSNTRFVYVEVPRAVSFWHVGYRGERIYYMMWQKQAVKIARELMKTTKFDFVHHITYVTCILPTYMHKLGLPFLYGPVSGGEKTPKVIRYPMSTRNRLEETIRTASQIFFKSTPNFARTMKKATLIVATTDETKMVIPEKYHDKVRTFQSIGLNSEMFYPEPAPKENKIPKFLMAGRMLYWKGYELGILAFVKALEQGCRAELTVLGDTENNPAYEAQQEKLKILCGSYLGKEIHFVSRVEHSKMKEFYDGFDVLLNCSLRDSGCFVVMEAMSRALPVIIVNTGGPKVNTTDETAIKIDPAPLEKMIDKMAQAIEKLAADKEGREAMGRAAREYGLKNFTLEARTKKMNEFYQEVLALRKRWRR